MKISNTAKQQLELLKKELEKDSAFLENDSYGIVAEIVCSDSKYLDGGLWDTVVSEYHDDEDKFCFEGMEGAGGYGHSVEITLNADRETVSIEASLGNRKSEFASKQITEAVSQCELLRISVVVYEGHLPEEVEALAEQIGWI